ncbi:MAG: transcription antitermination factor NusB [Candidatus Niyogibacteria bacterium]|nr:MAG: transcription antitermination factor NusB [Candidatus Niyogibacteria bacterium]
MANRHLSRSIVLQTLFEWDFNGFVSKSADAGLERNLSEFAPGLEDGGFSKKLIKGIVKKRKELDKIIEKAAPEWPLAQIAMIDRNVLRIGLYELIFGDRKEVPPKVAINEAIELAKTFGGDSSGRFVNGVLGTVYREMGEPGKDDDSQKKKKIADPSKLPREELGGGVVYRRENGKLSFALVHDVFGYWTLSKGHLEEDEDARQGTSRELAEELGLKNLELLEEIGVNEYIASDPKKGPVRRRVSYFLVEAKDKDLRLGPSGGLDDARWFSIEEMEDLKIYDDIRPLIQKALLKLK